MPALLHIIEGPSVFEVPCGAVVTIGRTDDNTVVLADPKVSRHHAMVRALGSGACFVVDTGSSNGTCVNGARIAVPRELKDDDAIDIGGHRIVFEADKDDAYGKSDTESIVLAPSTILTVGGVVEQITILVADVWGYTVLSAAVDPDDLAMIMGRLFAESSRLIEANGGVVDKFAGDAVMALWVGRNKQAVQAVRSVFSAVVGIQAAISAINSDFPGLPSRLRMGFGVNNGQAVLGTFGARHRREYTALGDAVNLAFRLEAATRLLNRDVVIGPDAYQLLDRTQWSGRTQSVVVKGKAGQVSVLALMVNELPPLALI